MRSRRHCRGSVPSPCRAGGLRGRGWTLREWISSAGGPKCTTYVLFDPNALRTRPSRAWRRFPGASSDRLQLLALGISDAARSGTGSTSAGCGCCISGVYAVGHEAVSPRGRLVAGLLVAGPGAALSHRTAAGLLEAHPFNAAVRRDHDHVDTAPQPPGPRLPQGRDDSRRTSSTPSRSPPRIRTLLDLAGDAPARRGGARVQRGAGATPDHRRGARAAARPRRRRPRPDRRRRRRPPRARSSSAASSEAVLKAGLPRPEVDTLIGGHRVDFLWPEQRLVVELDGCAVPRASASRSSATGSATPSSSCSATRCSGSPGGAEPATVTATIARFLSRPASRRAS